MMGLTNGTRMAASRRVVGNQSNAPVAHYSPAIVVDRIVYCSGSLGTDPRTGDLVEGGIQAQTRQALLNLDNVLAQAGSSLRHVVRMHCFLARTADFPAFERTYREIVPSPPPARSTVGAKLVVDGALVEIEATAIIAEAR